MGIVIFIKGDMVGGVENYIDEYYIKMLDRNNKVIVLCFSLEDVLKEVKFNYIDFFFFRC